MLEIKGKYNDTKIFNNNVENEALSQIYNLLCQKFITDSKVRIMPDCHKGEGGPIGLTMTIPTKIVVPNLVGVDIGCGMETVKLSQKQREIDLGALDSFIHKNIPAGFNVNEKEHKYISNIETNDLKCLKGLKKYDRIILSLGSLGGGNHFIECNKDSEDNVYLVIHSGSRNLGKQVAEYYQKLGYDILTNKEDLRKEIIDRCKRENRQNDIAKELSNLKEVAEKFIYSLSYVQDEVFDDYIHDMKIVQEFALWNRRAMMISIIEKMKFDIDDQFTTIHNYIDTDNMILRKGAISAKKDEKVLIPMNMRDGSLVCIGKGNEDWNYSAPHGAGRLMSRKKAKETIPMKDYKETMKDVYSTCISNSTIDESPMAYKPMDEIMNNIKDTVEIKEIIKPIYNFKSE